MKRSLPPDPSIEFDRKRAKELLAARRNGEPDAIARFAEHHPQGPSADPGAIGLHDAQLIIAREYSLPSWRALVEKIEAIDLERFKSAVKGLDIDQTRRLLMHSESLRNHINDPLFAFGGRAIHAAQSKPELIDVLLEFGADINLRSDWENGPFSVLDSCTEEAARHYIARGAKLTPHAAARLGWIDELRRMLDADASVVHEKGGDGQQPLHFARTPEIADVLLDRGAQIDAPCVDHKSTPAQYALADRPDVCRRLLERGATPDIFMAARLGDNTLAQRLLDVDPCCVATRINAPGYAPVPPCNIYCWTLGWQLSPHEVAMKFGNQSTFKLLMERSPASIRLLVACSRADEPTARAVMAEVPNLLPGLTLHEQGLMSWYMFYMRVPAVKLMLALGFDPAATGMDRGSLLHQASWHGNVEVVELLLKQHRDRIDLNLEEPTHKGTPIGWACHGSENSFCKSGDHAKVIRMLLEAGAELPLKVYAGTTAVRELLHNRGVPDAS